MGRIQFGTSGWRAVIAEDFTFRNVEIVAEAIARIAGEDAGGKPLRFALGYDGRFLSDAFARTAALTFVRCGASVLFPPNPIPTPVVSHMTRALGLDGGLVVTASHNPPEYNGLKYSPANGAPASNELAARVADAANALAEEDRPEARYPSASMFEAEAAKGGIERFDPYPMYRDQLFRLIDIEAVRKAKLTVAADVFYGSGRGYLPNLLEEAGCAVTTLRDRSNPSFDGGRPDPSGDNLSELKTLTQSIGAAVGLAVDGDADRFGVIDADGSYLHANHVLGLMLDYLAESRGWTGSVVRSAPTTHLLDAVAADRGLEVIETGTGFKYIGVEMLNAPDRFILGGEESSGMTMRGHTPEKDGVIACLLIAEMVAARGKPMGRQLQELFERVGERLVDRLDFELTEERKTELLDSLKTSPPERIGAVRGGAGRDDRRLQVPAGKRRLHRGARVRNGAAGALLSGRPRRTRHGADALRRPRPGTRLTRPPLFDTRRLGGIVTFGRETSRPTDEKLLKGAFRMTCRSFRSAAPRKRSARTALGAALLAAAALMTASADAQVLQIMRGHESYVESVAFSPDGTRIATASGDNTVRVWNAQTGESIHTLDAHTNDAYAVAFSPDGSRIASGAADDVIRIWDAETGEQLRVFTGHKDWINALAFSPDGTRIVSCADDDTARVWNAETGELIHTLQGHTQWVFAVAYSPDASRIATGGRDHTVRIWDAETGETIHILTDHTDEVNSAAFSPDGTRLLTGADDGTFRVWNAETGELLRSIDAQSNAVQSAVYSPDGTRIATGGSDDAVRVWDAETYQQLQAYRGHSGTVNSVAYTADGMRIASGSDDDTARVWNAKAGDGIQMFAGHTGMVHDVDYSADGARLASASRDRSVRIWDAETGETIHILTGHENSAHVVAYSPAGERAASAGGDNTVRIWDAEAGELIHTLTGHKDWINTVAYSPDGTKVASGADDRTIRIWDAETGENLHILTGHEDWIWSVVFSPDGTRLVSGSRDDAIRIWDAETGEHLHTINEHSRDVRSVDFSPDGTRFASGSYDRTIRVWDANTYEHLTTLSGHASALRAVRYSPDGSRIASSSYDNTVRIWDAQAGEHLETIVGHAGGARGINFSPDGTQLAAGNTLNMIVLFPVDTSPLPIAASVSGPTGSVTGTFQATVVFGGTPENFSADSLTVENGSASNVSGSGSVYTAEIEPAAAGMVAVSIADGAAGNNRVSNRYAVRYEPPLDGGEGSVLAVAYSPDGAFLVSGNADGTLQIRSARSGETIRTIAGHDGYVRSAAYSPDGSLIVSGSADGTVRVWNAETGEPLHTFETHTGVVYAVAFSPDGQTIASGGADSVIQLTDPHSGELRMKLEGHTGNIRAIAFSPDGRTLASGGTDRIVRLWDARSGEPTAAMEGHSRAIYTVAFSPDGQTIASGCVGTVRFWDVVAAGLKRAVGARGLVFSVAFSPDGQTLASGSRDGTLALWSAGNGRQKGSLEGHSGAVYAVAFSPDGQTLASGGRDRSLRLWDAPIANPDADGDGDVDSADLLLAANHYGKAVSADGPNSYCYAGLSVPIGGSCHYRGSNFIFTVDADGRGVFTAGGFVSARDDEIAIPSWNLDGVTVDFSASKEGDSWVVGSAGGGPDSDGADPRADVNGDGVVDVIDILIIADALAGQARAAPALAASMEAPSAAQVSSWLRDAERLIVQSEPAKRGSRVLESLLAALPTEMLPTRSALMPNFPNPFNPETWIPFELAEASEVRMTIYDAAGRAVRVLDLGYLPAGSYARRSKAAYWDGRNSLGEPVASGTYFVRIEAGSFSATRRMAIMK